MVLAILTAVLQIPGSPAQATRADTAYVTTVLDSAAAALHRADRLASPQPLGLIDHVQLWRGHEAAWREAHFLDERSPASEHYHKMWVLAGIMRDHKSAQARDYLLALSREARDHIIIGLQRSVSDIPAEITAFLPGLLTAPKARAEYFYMRALHLSYRHQRAAALDTLRHAIALMRDAGADYPLDWTIAQLALGESVPTEKLIELAIAESGRTGPALRLHAMQRVAEQLYKVDQTIAAVIADTLIRQIPDDTSTVGQQARFMLLKIRAAPGDSSAAVTLQERVQARRRQTDPRFATYDMRDVLHRAVQSRDTAALTEALHRWRDDPSAFSLLGAAWAVATRPAGTLPGAPLSSEEREMTSAMSARLWTVSTMLPLPGRDTVRYELIKTMARLNPAAALDSARTGMSARPQQDRARAQVLRRLVLTDAGRAEKIAGDLSDPAARDTAFAVLAEAAMASGRLGVARRLIDRMNSEGLAWIASRFALARALAATGAQQEAAEALRPALRQLNPVPACSDCAREVGAPPAPPALSHREIVDYLVLAVQLDLRRELDAWATSIPSDLARAWAWLTIADAFSIVKLGRFMLFPMPLTIGRRPPV